MAQMTMHAAARQVQRVVSRTRQRLSLCRKTETLSRVEDLDATTMPSFIPTRLTLHPYSSNSISHAKFRVEE